MKSRPHRALERRFPGYLGVVMERIHVDLRIRGNVQGVRYRQSALEVAVRLGISGFAMNLPDGSVAIEAEGPSAEVEKFIAWCRKGPPHALVSDVGVSPGALVPHAGFRIRR